MNALSNELRKIGDRTERAYRRGGAIEKRHALMTDWASYFTSQPAQAVPIWRAELTGRYFRTHWRGDQPLFLPSQK